MTNSPSNATPCMIYKSLKKEGVYLYIKANTTLQDCPEALIAQLGTLEFVMKLELSIERKLAQENSQEVINNINKQGYHLQIPRTDLLLH